MFPGLLQDFFDDFPFFYGILSKIPYKYISFLEIPPKELVEDSFLNFLEGYAHKCSRYSPYIWSNTWRKLWRKSYKYFLVPGKISELHEESPRGISKIFTNGLAKKLLLWIIFFRTLSSVLKAMDKQCNLWVIRVIQCRVFRKFLSQKFYPWFYQKLHKNNCLQSWINSWSHFLRNTWAIA